MTRLGSTFVACAVLALAGCIQTAETNAPAADAAMDQGDEAPVDAAPGSSAPTGDDGRVRDAKAYGEGAAGDESDPSTWPKTPEFGFIHNRLTCTEEPCNCGSNDRYMDADDVKGDCDAQGDRPALTGLRRDLHPVAGWPGRSPSHGWPAGTPSSGILYLTTDLSGQYTLQFRLLVNHAVVAQSENITAEVTNGWLGAVFTPIAFTMTTTKDIRPGESISLELWLAEAPGSTGYFIGYEDDHASFLRLG